MNELAREYPQYGESPKAVVAAIAFSVAMRLCCDDVDLAKYMIQDEWDVLHTNGIVPQKRR